MLSYEVLDRIADSHNPALGLVWLALSLLPIRALDWRLALARLGVGLVCLLTAYGYMWLDAAVHLWARYGLDYSTHTGVAVALCASVWACSRRSGVLALVLVALYLPLMVYQHYHTLADIITSAVAVGIPSFVFVLTAGRVRAGARAAANNSSKPTPLRGAA